MNAFKALFDTNGVKFIIYIDGLAHPVKGTEDAQRLSIREAAKIEFQSLARSGDPNMIESMEKAMSKACFVREDLIFNLKRWCDTNGINIIGSPFECDFQLVGDELLQQGGITVSMTIDSDFFALGSRIILDCLDIRTGCCNIIRRDKFFESEAGAILCNNDGTPFDMAVYASFVGCDFIAHPYLQSQAFVIKTLMPAWHESELAGIRSKFQCG
jgi:hypothetical protein